LGNPPTRALRVAEFWQNVVDRRKTSMTANVRIIAMLEVDGVEWGKNAEGKEEGVEGKCRERKW